MTLAKRQANWVIFASFIVALILTIMPLPEWARPFRPDWTALLLIYWCMAVPNRVGVGIGWTAGLVMDVSTGSLLGQHALSMALIAFITIQFHLLLRVYPLRQQAMAVFLLLFLHQLIALWVGGFSGNPMQSWLFMAPAFTGMLLWPWIYFILRDLRRRFRVS